MLSTGRITPRPRRKRTSSMSAAWYVELTLEALVPGQWVKEHRFHAARRWRFDYALVERMIAIEVEGVSRGLSRHTTIAGYRADCEKYRTAAALGWCVFRFTQDECDRTFHVELAELLELRP
jgi:very-short-patch-repair endonuclease